MVIRIEFRKAINSSGAVFLFWLIQTIAYIPLFISKLLDPTRTSDPVRDMVLYGTSGLTLIQFLLHMFPDNECLTKKDLFGEELTIEANLLYSGGPMDEAFKFSGRCAAERSEETTSLIQKITGPRPCQELLSSFISRITFAWLIRSVERILFRGFYI